MNATQEIESGNFSVPRWNLFSPDSIRIVNWNIDRGLKLRGTQSPHEVSNHGQYSNLRSGWNRAKKDSSVGLKNCRFQSPVWRSYAFMNLAARPSASTLAAARSTHSSMLLYS